MNERIERNRRYMLRAVSRAKAKVEQAKAELREYEIARDEFELRQRPTLPTTEMLLALEGALEAIKNREQPPSHIGRQLRGGVTVHGEWGHIWVKHGSPYRLAANGPLWRFTEPEIQRMRDHLKSFGATLETDWSYEQGHAFVVAK